MCSPGVGVDPILEPLRLSLIISPETCILPAIGSGTSTRSSLSCRCESTAAVGMSLTEWIGIPSLDMDSTTVSVL